MSYIFIGIAEKMQLNGADIEIIVEGIDR